LRSILTRRLTVRGFIRGDFLDQQASFFEDMSRRIRENRIKYREDIVEGLENAPRAFLKLFRSENFVKLLVNLKIKNELVYAVFNNFQSNI
jgi:NADPH-dependent curcumin reductase